MSILPVSKSGLTEESATGKWTVPSAWTGTRPSASDSVLPISCFLWADHSFRISWRTGHAEDDVFACRKTFEPASCSGIEFTASGCDLHGSGHRVLLHPYRTLVCLLSAENKTN